MKEWKPKIVKRYDFCIWHRLNFEEIPFNAKVLMLSEIHSTFPPHHV